MTPRLAVLALAVAVCLVPLASCKRTPSPGTEQAAPGAVATTPPEDETADQFVARVNAEYKAMYPELTAAQWLSSTYINEDSQLLASKAQERFLAQLNSWIEQAKKFEGKPMSAESARAIMLLKLGTALPPPKDPAHLAELTKIAAKMEGDYGSGTYCKTEGDAKSCRQLGELEDVLRGNRDYDAQLDAWAGWHTISNPMR